MILLVTFFFARILWGPYLQYSLYMSRDEWFTTEAGTLLFAPNFLIVIFFNFINYFWGEALFRKALKGVTPSDEEREEGKRKRLPRDFSPGVDPRCESESGRRSNKPKVHVDD